MTRIASWIVTCVVLHVGASAALARPCGQVGACNPITLQGPVSFSDPSGPPNIPPGGTTVDELDPPYAQDELFVSGTVNVFNYNSNPAAPGAAPGDNLIVQTANAPYKTRILVRRPAVAGDFNGTVVVEFFNSTAGFDAAPVWSTSALYFARKGIAWIGVTTSANRSVPYLKAGCGGFGASCGTRYASLVLTDNGQEYEIVSQLVTALKSRAPGQSPLPPDFRARRVLVSGQSQQAGSVITHANDFYFGLVDGYLVAGNVFARPIRGLNDLTDPAGTPTQYCGDPGVPAYPSCIARLPVGLNLVRTHLPAPVYQILSETDLPLWSSPFFRQADTDTSCNASYRLVEIAASAHAINHKDMIVPGITIGDLCLYAPNGAADGPIFSAHVTNAYFRHMEEQIRQGELPPHAARIQTNPDGSIVRDSFQNAVGGVRLPEVDVPTNSYFSPFNTGKPACGPGESFPQCLPPSLAPIAPLACHFLGSYSPLPAATLHSLYPTHKAYVRQIVDKTEALVDQGFLLPQDAQLHKQTAKDSNIGN
jgi:hypothetical protein